MTIVSLIAAVSTIVAWYQRHELEIATLVAESEAQKAKAATKQAQAALKEVQTQQQRKQYLAAFLDQAKQQGLGISVNKYMGRIKWDEVKRTKIGKAPIVFAFATATYGYKPDPFFEHNWTGIKAAKLRRGAVHIFWPAVDPKIQANSFLSALGKMGSSDLPPAVYLPGPDQVKWPDSDVVVRRLSSLLTTIENKTKSRPMICTSPSVWNEKINSNQFRHYPLWVVHYNSGSTPASTHGWKEWTLWEYMYTKVAGVNSEVNLIKWNLNTEVINALATDSSSGGTY